MYSERIGALTLLCANGNEADRCMSQLKVLACAMYLCPPKNGSRIVAEILRDSKLKEEWRTEVNSMANRIIKSRKELRTLLEKLDTKRSWSHITEQKGMFSYSGLTSQQVR